MYFPDGVTTWLKKQAETNPGVANGLKEAEAAAISAARETERLRKAQEAENKKQGDHRKNVEGQLQGVDGRLQNVENGQKKIIEQGNDLARTAKANKKMMERALDPKGTSELIDSLKKQVVDGQELNNRYRRERDAANTENLKLKKSIEKKDREIAALEKSNDDKDRKIAALERQLAAASTS